MDLQPGDLTTLGKLPVGSVGEYVDSNEQFIVVKNDSYPWVGIGYADGGRSVKISGLMVRYHGPGRIEPARIVLDSEPDRVRELEDQVRVLREALLLWNRWNVTPSDRGGRWGTKGKAFSEFVEAKDAALAATAPKETPCTT